ncbi:MAG TPA: DoxX family membrane protein [Thermoanaerobaculia bacterium]|nr:DoxX family membrane protein [Thermoanaerobaculia bacterium]
MNPNLDLPFRALRFGLGLGAFLAGLDKFFNILAQWEAYLSPLATQMIPLSPAVLMRAVGVIEMLAGVIVLAGFTRLGGYVIAGWLLVVAASLVTTGRFFDVAVRDVLMAVAAVTLARLSEVRAHAPRSVHATPQPAH